jgi:hypothetical protein
MMTVNSEAEKKMNEIRNHSIFKAQVLRKTTKILIQQHRNLAQAPTQFSTIQSIS